MSKESVERVIAVSGVSSPADRYCRTLSAEKKLWTSKKRIRLKAEERSGNLESAWNSAEPTLIKIYAHPPRDSLIETRTRPVPV